ncbi:PIG-L deacetylase family protein [Notoacmeibacter marinus]|uniref:PIG-L deacetylase family protein n=1 Tax=Notoacmeibacter marinus TaxID=1876515 RepID=UPI001FDF5799|nr:PIG-L family deacetylase [Notoacmeibacter marinus]
MKGIDLNGVRHAVIVAPHSDDETIAAFHLICALRRRGVRVDIVVVTDGSASHRNSASWPKPRLVAERRRETMRAMAMAGVPRDRIEFLGLPDGGLRSLDRKQIETALVGLRQRPEPDLLIVPSVFDDHPDHRVVARLCERAWPKCVKRLHYIVWPDRQNEARPSYCDLAVAGCPLRKRLVMRRYRTQTGIITDDPAGFSLMPPMLTRMCRSHERFAS